MEDKSFKADEELEKMKENLFFTIMSRFNRIKMENATYLVDPPPGKINWSDLAVKINTKFYEYITEMKNLEKEDQ